MKQYDVKISYAALSDMEQIYSYIADRLLEPDTAMGQYNRIAEAIQSLFDNEHTVYETVKVGEADGVLGTSTDEHGKNVYKALEIWWKK